MSDTDRSSMFYYVCQHGASNTPDGCFPGAEPVPDDWMSDPQYLPKSDPGTTDAVS